MGVKVIITGATGMVGEGVLHECLIHPDVEKVLIINRKSTGLKHAKLEEIVHADFYDLSAVESRLLGYTACFFCLGVSSLGMREERYHRVTFDLTLNFANTLHKLNPDLIFCYVSGSGTDSSEMGRSMWARVKGKTENHLLLLGFKDAYMFRPGFMYPTPGLKNTLKFYRFVNWMYPGIRKFFPKYVSTLKELGLAMIHAVTKGYSKSVLEVEDIVALAK
ncbi:NAD-dependent epimerase/dehydratase family protein [Chryseolinea sp. H1M3-3]|uniref:NAD-dependent epimerase/dehydratase family protein n=1 Tax=Chryseolinea sp. H1M3-3 TaxID=3034144 RepID=UPI0023EC823E|nr:NAD-dependent epimerase/dehydratase family protein [Chryseolinea sp. H1M3-3]